MEDLVNDARKKREKSEDVTSNMFDEAGEWRHITLTGY